VNTDVLDLKLVVGSSMIEVVTQTANHQGKRLHFSQVSPQQTAALFNT